MVGQFAARAGSKNTLLQQIHSITYPYCFGPETLLSGIFFESSIQHPSHLKFRQITEATPGLIEWRYRTFAIS
jgi:hypothetical protein